MITELKMVSINLRLKGEVMQHIQNYMFYSCFLSVNTQQDRAGISFCSTKRLTEMKRKPLAETQSGAFQ